MINEHLYEFDRSYRTGDKFLLCGVDEAGRGPLAGPVCCAAVILDESARFDCLNDSKKLAAKQREKLYDEITGCCVAYSVVMIDNEIIDEINILQATMLGMRQALFALSVKPDIALIDGNRVPESDVGCKAVIKGDSRSASIAAASVIAKVTRDSYMIKLDVVFNSRGVHINLIYSTYYTPPPRTGRLS